MKQKTQTMHWIIDAALLFGFLLAFFLDLTGLAVHQWLGVALGALAVYHLFRHKNWILMTLERFFRPTSWRVRVYTLLDAGILLGFTLMVLTGLAMSTWFNLPLADYDLWYNLHVASSVITLLAVVVKLGLHWRWIVITFQKMVSSAGRSVGSMQPLAPQPAPVAHQLTLSRRQFLTTMGLVSVGAALALSNVLGNRNQVNSQSLESAPTADPTPASTATPTAQPPAAATPTSQPVAAATAQPTAVPTAVPTTQPTAYVCTYRCRKGRHCTFPGQCHSYTDLNNNGYCDLGECS